MTQTEDLFNEVVSLPIDIRMQLIDKLLQSIQPINEEIDKLWADEAEKRVQEIKSGKVNTIAGEEVFNKIYNIYK
ncbi:MAG: addiction module protein [Candidatus Acididesulfobacter diazotrophicus]|jgi:putative addiction module component (TIGR02574 family)|uniref:Addiction module protein n=1 Tax=Candidatus Acididesulfobacter diazotrophicus TaxID=2597226 RepID=A0A519BN02_9DELT|nr:MAG: addiction module protein [Candidatus Acididesulfobacter diazotrophicus]